MVLIIHLQDSNRMDSSLLAVRDISHKYIVVEKGGNE
nr:MAG TPA: hypothetical protein [Caudoviricetes sp.]